MKKIAILFLILLLVIFSCGCGSNDHLIQERDNLISEIQTLKAEKSNLEALVAQEKVDKGVARYIVTFNIKQKHYIDINAMIKDSMNDVSIPVPVDKEYYDSVKVGDVVNDEFRWGSFVISGSFGEWSVTVEKKEII